MAKLQRDDSKMLWDEMGSDKSWSSLHHVLENHLEKSKGIEDSTVKRMLGMMDSLENSQEAFPESAGKLADLLNERMTHEQGHGQQKQQKQHDQHPEHQQHTQHQGQHHEQRQQHAPHEERSGAGPHPPQQHEEMRAQHNKADQQQTSMLSEQQHNQSGQDHAGKQTGKGMAGQHQKMGSLPYQPAHVEILYARGNWKSWDEMIMWLVNEAANDPSFDDAEVESLVRDLDALRQAGVPFTPNYTQAIELVRRG